MKRSSEKLETCFRRHQSQHPVPLLRSVLRRRKRVTLHPFPVLRP
ncbi:hypothetical protein NEISICOT_00150 [Neisseria sicca ATCC 29256]|uniref:Uncharacterized protein n=1 Tax=Neisseria sicca ATCC 29256 TaxID=547045 RepID=C6M0X3_NEISI|nr:hypothetical protein NEISICOT_00150 [Neisseria sicca ATCC 29256]